MITAMDIQQMKYFLVAAETEHITKAAQRLSLAQPALTQSLHRLEHELGTSLFSRPGRNVRLTAEGAWLRDQWKPLVAQLEAVEEGLQQKVREESATVSICIGSASVLAIDALAAFSEHNPTVRFRVVQEEANVDVVVESFGPQERASDGALFTEAIGIALPASDPREGPISLADLAGDRFIQLAGSRRLSSICNQCCAAHGFSYRASFISDNPSVVRKMIGLGLGVGFWPEYSWGPLGSKAKLVSLQETNFRRTVGLRLTASGFEKPAAVAFYEFLRSWFEELWGKE